MDTEFLARVQFALTIAFHYLFPPMSIGLSVLVVLFLGLHLKTQNPIYHRIGKFLVKLFALSFAIGVATGIVMEMQFGLNWANFSRFIGDVASGLLGSETMIAFFIESTFLAVLLFGWDKVSPKIHFLSAILVSVGAHLSALWIVMLNSWMNTPAGFQIVQTPQGPRAEVTDIWAVAFNPSAMERFSHVITAAWLTGGFLFLSICCYYLLKKRHIEFSKASLKVLMPYLAVVLLLQSMSAHASAVGVAHRQPEKLAALEGLFKTEPSSAMSLFGIVNEEEQKMDYELYVPGVLSFLVHNNFTTPVAGLDQFPKENHPPVRLTYYSYRTMLGVWGGIASVILLGYWLLKKEKIWEHTLYQKAAIGAFMLPQIGNQAGWFSAEWGRQPWLVYGLMRRSEGFSSSVPPYEILVGSIMFTVVYSIVIALTVYLMLEKINHGPEEAHETPMLTHQ
jgi:cytochrome d ubiquinol oxidase subunit I